MVHQTTLVRRAMETRQAGMVRHLTLFRRAIETRQAGVVRHLTLVRRNPRRTSNGNKGCNQQDSSNLRVSMAAVGESVRIRN